MFDKRPSVRLQLPAIGAGIMKNKLFAPGRFPEIEHDDENVLAAVKWLIKAAELDRKMLDAAYWGQSGSVGISLRVIDMVPVVKIWKGHQCTPRFNDQDRLQSLIVHYPVRGSFLKSQLSLSVDREKTQLQDEGIYWYTRIVDETAIWTVQPITFDNWNPVDYDAYEEPTIKKLNSTHNIELDFPTAEWIRNGGVQIGCDGQSTFGLAIPNCIGLDYGLSQFQRGLNAAAVPTLTVKGRILNYERGGTVQVGPNSMIQLEDDRQEGPSLGHSGAGAEYLEMSGDGIKIGMEDFVKQVQHWTKDIMSMSNKDPDTIQGAISGKALEIINELPLDAVKVQQLAYGPYGLKRIICKLGNMLILLKHPKFEKVTPEKLEEINLKQKAPYPANPQEAQPLVNSVLSAVAGGTMHPDTGDSYLHAQLGISPRNLEEDATKVEKRRQQALEAIGKSDDLAGGPEDPMIYIPFSVPSV